LLAHHPAAHDEVHDRSFAIAHLDAGDETIVYRITARTPGRFTALPPQIFDMYNPDVHAASKGSVLEIR
jgi:uncharacterized protein YfaS (alpha-2-macroglobulin family)